MHALADHAGVISRESRAIGIEAGQEAHDQVMHAVDAPDQLAGQVSLEQRGVEVLPPDLAVRERQEHRAHHVVLGDHLRGAGQRKVEEVAATHIEADVYRQDHHHCGGAIGERIRDRVRHPRQTFHPPSPATARPQASLMSTLTLLRVACEYGHMSRCAISISCCACSRLTPSSFTDIETLMPKPPASRGPTPTRAVIEESVIFMPLLPATARSADWKQAA